MSGPWEGFPHGSVVALRGGVVAQVLALPSPPGMVTVLPKYVLCKEGLWGRTSTVRLCRVLGDYTVESVEKATGLVAPRVDGLYGAPMPYVLVSDVVGSVTPLEACKAVASGRAPAWAVETLYYAARSTELAACTELGVTGSVAGGFSHEASDLDLVAYVTPSKAPQVYESFSMIGEQERTVIEYTGLFKAKARVGWRRRLVRGRRVTLTIAPESPSSHCPPLAGYYRLQPPEGKVKVEIEVEEGRGEALLYPPCTPTLQGLYIVSFEYNIAGELYQGGSFTVEGIKAGKAIYIAVRNNATSIRRTQA